jgi:hypothetical protein
VLVEVVIRVPESAPVKAIATVVVPGRDPDHYAWINATVQRNLYRISLP